jgi:DNA primase
MNEATQLAEYFFQSLGKQVDMNSLEGRARLGRMALPHIEKVPKGIYHQLMLDQLSTITGVALQTLEGMEKTPDTGRNLDTIPVRSKPPARKNPAGRSVCMRAVNLILLKPGVAGELEQSDLAAIDSPDMDLLLQVVTLAQKHPSSTTPELLGRIYATPLGSQLTQLLNREQITPTEGIEQEFNDIIGHLLETHRRKLSHHSWIEKARQKLDSRRNSGSSDATGEENTPNQG